MDIEARKRTVFFVSCSTGITAETLGHSLLTQFDGIEFRNHTLPFVDNKVRAERAIQRINDAAVQDGLPPMVFSTLTNEAIRRDVAGARCVFFDLFDAFIGRLEAELNQQSTHAVGRSHGVSNQTGYMARMDAVNFALINDDGVNTKNFNQSDVVLIGVSRAGKTPTCIYMAMQYGVRAANYPLTEEDLELDVLPQELMDCRHKLYGLTINARRLQEIRNERRPNSRYASAQQCRYEINRAESLFRQHNIPFINTSGVSVEEIATTILHDTGIARRIF